MIPLEALLQGFNFSNNVPKSFWRGHGFGSVSHCSWCLTPNTSRLIATLTEETLGTQGLLGHIAALQENEMPPSSTWK